MGKSFLIAGNKHLSLVVTLYVKNRGIVVLITKFAISFKKIVGTLNVQLRTVFTVQKIETHVYNANLIIFIFMRYKN